jgi:Tol biopolymer transport system component
VARTTALPLLTAVVVAGALTGVLSGPLATNASTAPSSWRLVYERYDAKRGQGGTGLEIVAASHARPRVIARERTRRESYTVPQWSPDGTHIAFAGHVGGQAGIYVIRSDGTRLVRAASTHSDDFVWSRDSERIAFVSECEIYSPRDGLTGCGNGRLEVASKDGGPSRILARLTSGRARSDIRLSEWSPDAHAFLLG